MNLLYNLTLTMVIKHGSAALMYIAAALVLPLGSITFNSTMIMGVHATVWTVYTISGLCVVLFGMFWAGFFFSFAQVLYYIEVLIGIGGKHKLKNGRRRREVVITIYPDLLHSKTCISWIL
jgi:hypothetical protein